MYGQMVPPMMESGLIIKSTATAPTCGKTAVNTTVSGSITTCRVVVSTSTRMVCVMMASTSTIKKRDLVSTTGLMAVSMRAGGTKVNNTGSVLILTFQRARLGLGSGSMESA